MQALVIILVIMIVSNFAVGIFNKMVPPCGDSSEYFQNASKLPDGAVMGLGSIPSHTGFDYVGAARLDAGGGIIGLTSYPSAQKNGYVNEKSKSIEGYITQMHTTEEDPSDCAVSTKAKDEISNILQTGKKHRANADSRIVSNSKAGSLNEFEVSMEGIMTKNKLKKATSKNHRDLSHNSLRDGYA